MDGWTLLLPGPPPSDSPAISHVTGAPLPPSRSSCLVGRQHPLRELVGGLDFFSVSRPSRHPFPASPPSGVGKETTPGKHALNFHLSTAEGSPRSGPALSDPSLPKIKARQKLCLLFPSCQRPEIPSRSKAYHSSGRFILGEGAEVVI